MYIIVWVYSSHNILYTGYSVFLYHVELCVYKPIWHSKTPPHSFVCWWHLTLYRGVTLRGPQNFLSTCYLACKPKLHDSTTLCYMFCSNVLRSEVYHPLSAVVWRFVWILSEFFLEPGHMSDPYGDLRRKPMVTPRGPALVRPYRGSMSWTWTNCARIIARFQHAQLQRAAVITTQPKWTVRKILMCNAYRRDDLFFPLNLLMVGIPHSQTLAYTGCLRL